MLWILKPTFIERISRGGVSECPVSVAEIFISVLFTNAYSIMVFHNHPSGDCIPREEDKIIANKILATAKLLDMYFLDYIIMGEKEAYYSFKESGLLF